MAPPIPTILVGVGQTGIDVINQVDRSNGFGWGEEYDHLFEYIAIDATRPELEKAPENATRVFFELPGSDRIDEDRQRYPYMINEVEVEPYGTERQRRVGRYRLDNTAPATWEDLTTTLLDVIRPRVESLLADASQPNILNIVHIHSLGGGTGSGTFPLIGHLIGDVTDELKGNTRPFSTNTVGIGVVPELDHSLETVTPPGDNRVYANTFAALRDLGKLLNVDSDTPLPLYRYATVDTGCEDSRDDVEKVGEHDDLTTCPYDNYFLTGIDEGLMTAPNDSKALETHREMVDNRIGAAIYGLAMRSPSFVGVGGNQGWQEFGAFDNTELSIPIEDVRAYCDLAERINVLRRQLQPDSEKGGTLQQTLEQKRSQRDHLTACETEPARAVQEFDDSDAVRSSIRTLTNRQLRAAESITDISMESVDRILENVEQEYDDSVLPFALDLTVEWVEANESASERLSDVVSSIRQDFDLETRDRTATERKTLSESAQLVQSQLSEEIERLEEHITSDSRRVPRLLRAVFDFFPRRRLKRYQARFRELQERQEAHDSVKNLLQKIRTRRQTAIENCFEQKIDRLDREIDDLRTEISEKEAELEQARQRKREKVEQLSTAKYENRLCYVALDEQRIAEDLDHEMLDEELTSIVAFQEHGFLKRDLQEILENRMQRSYAWDSKLLTWRPDGRLANRGVRGTTTREIWMLHHEENAELAKPNPLAVGNCTFYRSTENADFPEFTDPYTIQFMSFTATGPISDLTLYSTLEEAAEDGRLDRLLTHWNDYRFAVAYPEWYD